MQHTASTEENGFDDDGYEPTGTRGGAEANAAQNHCGALASDVVAAEAALYRILVEGIGFHMAREYEIDDESWQTAKDTIVECVLGGNNSKDLDDAKRSFEWGLEERDGPDQEESVVEIGAWISKDSVPDEFDKDEFEFYLDDFDDERLSALQNGASPTRDEFSGILVDWLSRECEFQEGDCIRTYGIYPLVHSDGKQCFFIGTISGYSMSYTDRIEGYSLDTKSAMNTLRKTGFICADSDNEGDIRRFICECLSKEKNAAL